MSKGMHYFAAADERMASVLICVGTKTGLSSACLEAHWPNLCYINNNKNFQKYNLKLQLLKI